MFIMLAINLPEVSATAVMIKYTGRTLNNSSETHTQKVCPSHCVSFVLAIVTVLSGHMEWFRPLGPPTALALCRGHKGCWDCVPN